MMIFTLSTNQSQMHFREDVRMEHKVKTLQEPKTIFDKLKIDPKSLLFSIVELNTKQLRKLKKSPYTKDKQ